jgi:hypothetical protein
VVVYPGNCGAAVGVLSCRKRPALSRFAPSNQEVPHDAKEADLQLRVMAPKELALFVTLRRRRRPLRRSRD